MQTGRLCKHLCAYACVWMDWEWTWHIQKDWQSNTNAKMSSWNCIWVSEWLFVCWVYVCCNKELSICQNWCWMVWSMDFSIVYQSLVCVCVCADFFFLAIYRDTLCSACRCNLTAFNSCVCVCVCVSACICVHACGTEVMDVELAGQGFVVRWKKCCCHIVILLLCISRSFSLVLVWMTAWTAKLFIFYFLFHGFWKSPTCFLCCSFYFVQHV
jgi:hypothetical protein